MMKENGKFLEKSNINLNWAHFFMYRGVKTIGILEKQMILLVALIPKHKNGDFLKKQALMS